MTITNVKNLNFYLHCFAFLLTEKNVSNVTYDKPKISDGNNEIKTG